MTVVPSASVIVVCAQWPPSSYFFMNAIYQNKKKLLKYWKKNVFIAFVSCILLNYRWFSSGVVLAEMKSYIAPNIFIVIVADRPYPVAYYESIGFLVFWNLSKYCDFSWIINVNIYPKTAIKVRRIIMTILFPATFSLCFFSNLFKSEFHLYSASYEDNSVSIVFKSCSSPNW